MFAPFTPSSSSIATRLVMRVQCACMGGGCKPHIGLREAFREQFMLRARDATVSVSCGCKCKTMRYSKVQVPLFSVELARPSASLVIMHRIKVDTDSSRDEGVSAS